MSRIEQIGNCTLYLGDCREILPTLDKVDAVVTDPPFGMCFVSNFRREETKHMPIQNDDTPDLLRWACGIPVKHSKYVFCRWDNLSNVPKPESAITWVKNNWSMGDLEHEHGRMSELCLFYTGEDHSFPNKRPVDVISCARTGNNHHPTEKPVDLMRSIVEWTDGVVLDPFMGSGTTGVACAKLGRKFIGIELEPKYFDIACKRIDEAYRQPDMFIAPPAKDETITTLFDGVLA